MSIINKTIEATAEMFRGLAESNLPFHQCIAELIDNAIAARNREEEFSIEVVLQPHGDNVTVFVIDNGTGMSLDLMDAALNIGRSATTSDRLNEHGFGLKNALATLSLDTQGEWTIWSRTEVGGRVVSVSGPFGSPMQISDEETWPNLPFASPNARTIVSVGTTLSFLQTVQGSGRRARDISALRLWLLEHIGVLYRGYLEQKPDGTRAGNIRVTIAGTNIDRVTAIPVQVPFASYVKKTYTVRIDGCDYQIQYVYGVLDEADRANYFRGQGLKYYYRKTQSTQGIDVRLGDRVIATAQLEAIWRADEEGTPMARAQDLNTFVGELRIPVLPRGVLRTKNDKSAFSDRDENWRLVFDPLEDTKPLRRARQETEASLKRRLKKVLEGTSTGDVVSLESNTWPTGTPIDVLRTTRDGRLVVYEVKIGKAKPLDLYQLKMYWDGLVLHNAREPDEAILLCSDYASNLEDMANLMNTAQTPKAGSRPYNFRLQRLDELGLQIAGEVVVEEDAE